MTRATSPAPGARSARDAELVRRILAGDQEAFAQLVEAYESLVYSSIYSTLRSHEETDDIAQTVFVKVYFGIRNGQYGGYMLAWIHRIAVNECYSWLRRKRSSRVVYESNFSPVAWRRTENSQPASDGRITLDSSTANYDMAVRLLETLSSEDRQLMLLKEVEGYSIAELAQLTGLREGTVKVRLFRARRKLLRSAGSMDGKGVPACDRLIPAPC